MLLWYVWMGLRDGTWHKLDDMSKQLHLPKKAIEWAAKYLCDKGMAEPGSRKDEIRIHAGSAKFEDAVKALVPSSKSEQ